MIPPELPPDEPSRLAALHRLGLLDGPPDDGLDRFVRLALRLFGTAAAGLSVVDRRTQHYLSIQGLDLRDLPRDASFGGHTILAKGPLWVPDAAIDPRFQGSPLVDDAGVRFYAGVPLAVTGGHVVGTLEVYDREPRARNAQDLEALIDLGGLAAEAVSRAEHQSKDPTTGLLDRRGFDRAARSMLRSCQEEQRPAILFHISLDLLDLIDEAHGHEEGETALKELGRVLATTFRRDDLLARIGAEHFCALCPGATIEDTRTLTTRIQRRVEAANVLRGPKWPLSYKVAYAVYEPGSDTDWMELLAISDPQSPRQGNTPEPQYRRS